MDLTLRVLRFLLTFGWVVPVSWALSGSAAGVVGILLPVYVFLAFGLALTVGLEILPAGTLSGKFRVASGLVVAAAASGLAILTILAQGNHLTPQGLGTNIAVLYIEAFLVTRLRFAEPDYDAVLNDLRIGVIALVFLLAMVYHFGHSSATTGGLPLAGSMGYGILGIVALSTARRFARDEYSKDVRAVSIDRDWALGLVLTVIVVGALSLIVGQLAGIDAAGAAGTVISPVVSASGRAAANAAAEILSFIYWIGSWLGIKPPKPGHHITIPGPTGSKNPNPTIHLKHGKRQLETISNVLKALGIAAAAVVCLLAATLGVRKVSHVRPDAMSGETRTSSWSWRKMSGWLFHRTAQGLAAAIAGHIPHIPRPHSPRTVRDVYRSYLRFGEQEARARNVSETGLEYSADVGGRWVSAHNALADLNRLYMDERYGSTPPSVDVVRQAKGDLRAVENAAAGQR